MQKERPAGACLKRENRGFGKIAAFAEAPQRGVHSPAKAPFGKFSGRPYCPSGSLHTSTHSPPVLFCNSSPVSFTALLALPAAG